MKKAMLALAAIAAATVFAEEAKTTRQDGDLAKRQARSVHLRYGAERPIAAAEATVTVTETTPQTYFSILSWHQGYCGIQDWGDQKVFIFSVWDPSDPFDFGAKPDDMEETRRARVLYNHPLVQVSRFGGEGSGAKTLCGLNWTVGIPVSVRIETVPADDGRRTAFTCFVKTGEDGEWEKVATISTLRDTRLEPGLVFIASFVEDFRRNFVSAKESRSAKFGNVRVKHTADGEWVPVMRAQFSADGNPAETIDAGQVEPGTFFLKTGGGTKNENAKLWSWIG